MRATRDDEAIRRSDLPGVVTCWNCANKDVLMITEKIDCHVKGCIVYPWEAKDCKDYLRE